MDSKEQQYRLDRYWVEDLEVPSQYRFPQLDDDPSATTVAAATPHNHTLSAIMIPMSDSAYTTESTTSSQSSRRSKAPDRSFSGSSTSTVSDTPYDCGYHLPCEFEHRGCPVWFHGLEVKLWLAHSYSHFQPYLPPTTSVCIFCDSSFESPSKSMKDLNTTWQTRMMHISAHYQTLEPLATRPDFHVIDHLWKIGKLTKEEYDFANTYSERPRHFDHPDLVPLGTIRPDTEIMNQRKREEREDKRSQHAYNLAKEERLLKRQKKRANLDKENIRKGIETTGDRSRQF